MDNKSLENVKHPYEVVMGKGPYRIISYIRLKKAAVKDSPGTLVVNAKCLVGRCTHCNRPIKHNFIITNQNYQQFAIGTTCVKEKSLAKHITNLEDELYKLKVLQQNERKEAEKKKSWNKLVEMREWWDLHRIDYVTNKYTNFLRRDAWQFETIILELLKDFYPNTRLINKAYKWYAIQKRNA